MTSSKAATANAAVSRLFCCNKTFCYNVSMEILENGIAQLGVAYIENPDFDLKDFNSMVMAYLIDTLIQQHSVITDWGIYSHSETHGWTGWITDGEQTLFFSPTKTVIQ